MTMIKKRPSLPGSGLDCECGEHRVMCRFGNQHSWSTYLAAALVSNWGINADLAERGIIHCFTCNAVHVPSDLEREEWE